MPISGGLTHSKLPSDAEFSVREQNPEIRTEDREQFSAEFVAQGLLALRNVLGELANRVENRSFVVDEYNTCPISGAASESTLTLQPTYEYKVERIESILITGPPAAQITLVLGDRQWPMVIPAAGVLPIGPLGLFLDRSQARYLTASTPGTYTLELMGFADARYRI